MHVSSIYQENFILSKIGRVSGNLAGRCRAPAHDADGADPARHPVPLFRRVVAGGLRRDHSTFSQKRCVP